MTHYRFDRRQLSKDKRDVWCTALREGYFMPKNAGHEYYMTDLSLGSAAKFREYAQYQSVFDAVHTNLNLNQMADLIEHGVLET